jgi:hypothetical protein
MLKNHYNKWKTNQLIDLAAEKINEPYKALVLDLAEPPKARSKIVEAQDNRRVLPQLNSALPLLEGPAYPFPVAPSTAPGQTTFVTATRGAPQNQQLKEGLRVREIRDGPGVRGSHGWTGGNPGC